MLSKIFYGKEGCGMNQKALRYAKELLCVGNKQTDCQCRSCSISNMAAHPDLLIMDSDKYLAEDVKQITSFAKKTPIMSSECVVLIYGFHNIDPKMQNKLLKDLEDNQTFRLVGTASLDKGIVLDTIKSRTSSEVVYPLSKKAFLDICKDTDAELYFYMTGGCIERVDSMKEYVSTFKKVKQSLESDNRVNLLSSLGLIQEKDKNCFYTKTPELVTDLFLFMERVLFSTMKNELQVSSFPLLEVINNEIRRAQEAWYGSNDFFLSICRIIEC